MAENRVYACKMAKQPKKLPIDPASDDPFYRYQTHQLNVQVVGRGKMIRTYFLNVDEVAADLHVPADYLPSFFAQNIGAQANFDAKKPERERASISGEYSLETLSDMLALFMTKFVMCGNCRLAELSFHPLAKRVGVKCRSCGWKTYVDEMDLHPKFQRYVQNHPPPKSADLDKNAVKGQEAVRKREKEDSKMMKAAEGLDVGGVNDDDVEWGTDLSDAAMAARAAEMVPEKLKTLVELGGLAAPAAAAPAAAAPAAATVGVPTDATRVEAVRAALGKSTDEAIKTVVANGSNESERAAVLCDACIGSLTTMSADVNKHAAVLQAFVASSPANAAAILRWWQAAVARVSEADRAPLQKKTPVQCKTLYDADIVTEDAFVAWSKADGKSSVLCGMAAPFLQWLAQAEEDGDEEE